MLATLEDRSRKRPDDKDHEIERLRRQFETGVVSLPRWREREPRATKGALQVRESTHFSAEAKAELLTLVTRTRAHMGWTLSDS